MEIVLSAVVANFNGFTNDQLLEYISKEIEGLEYYEPVRIPGHIYASSKKWKAIGRVGQILTIADILWKAYSEIIVPDKTPESNQGIIIQVEGNHNNIWLGSDVKTKADLIEKLKINTDSSNIDSIKTKIEVDSLRNSNRWKRIK